jgi:hypothetical protein
MMVNCSQTEGMVSRTKGYTQHIIPKYFGYWKRLPDSLAIAEMKLTVMKSYFTAFIWA